MDGFVSYEEIFEEDAIFYRQPVEIDKKMRRREGTGDIVDYCFRLAGVELRGMMVSHTRGCFSNQDEM